MPTEHVGERPGDCGALGGLGSVFELSIRRLTRVTGARHAARRRDEMTCARADEGRSLLWAPR